jgi:hypothetical protein
VWGEEKGTLVSEESLQGWHPDPFSPSRERWWDGSKWTISTRPVPEETRQTQPELPNDATISIPIVSESPPEIDVVEGYTGYTVPSRPVEGNPPGAAVPTAPSGDLHSGPGSDRSHENPKVDVNGDRSGARRWGLVVAASVFAVFVVGGTVGWLASSLFRGEQAAVADEVIGRGPIEEAGAPDDHGTVHREVAENEPATEPERKHTSTAPANDATDKANDATDKAESREPSESDGSSGSSNEPEEEAHTPIDSRASDNDDIDEVSGRSIEGEPQSLEDASSLENTYNDTSSAPVDAAPGINDDLTDDPEPVQRTVTLDGQCVVTADESLLANREQSAAWEFPECRWAHIALPPGEKRWIVVYTSLNGNDFGSDDALQRAAENRVPGNVLWSSHYPSLNPGVWVIYEGPYMTEEEAKAATRRVGGRAYPRALSNDVGDRYCVGSDNCVGETAD